MNNHNNSDNPLTSRRADEGKKGQAVLPDRNCQFVLALRFIFLIASLLSQAVHPKVD